VPLERHPLAGQGVWAKAAAQSRAAADPRPVTSVQLTLDLGDEPQEQVSGLPEMSAEERMRAELEILGLDASRHVVDTYADFLDALGAVRSRDLLQQRSRSEILVAGVKVATQTPPVRSGRRVVFLTLDDGTGPVDATFFEDVQGPYAATVFGSWLLVVRGEVRRTGHRGISLRATGAWPLTDLHARWGRDGLGAVRAHLTPSSDETSRQAEEVTRHRVLTHSSGFQMSPYADVKPAGEDTKAPPRKPWVEEVAKQPSRNLWHRSPGSPG
jgi:error-prone DNA polymerase